MTTDQLVIGGNVNDSRDSTVHLSGLLDVNSAVLLREHDDSVALVTKGGIDTARVFVYGTDTRVMGALMTGPGRRRVVKAAVIHQSSRRAELVAEPGVFRPSGPGPDLLACRPTWRFGTRQTSWTGRSLPRAAARGDHGNIPL